MSGDRHVVGIVGGACAGSVVAEKLAESGCEVVVFEQNRRPYGKIEDGLPRWHAKQRDMEYRKIDARLDRPEVHFVPNTRLGQDLDFLELAKEWGFSVLVLANGAWKDRELDDPRARDVIEKGLIYQNPFVYWFNHYHEDDYEGPRYEVPPQPVCVGGGLASIDVIKIFQLELYAKALRARGVEVDLHEMEHQGIPKYCAEHGVEDPAELGVRNAILLYRRRVEDMPLASPPKNASEKVLAKMPKVRRKIFDKVQSKFLFEMRPQVIAKELILEDGVMKGLILVETELEGRNVKVVEGSEHELRSELVVSSIGSIPEPIEGIEQKGAYYRFKDWDTGEYEPLPDVFAAGNVVTGQGNIVASVEHGRFVGEHLAERYLGLSGDRDLSEGLARGDAKAEALAEQVNEAIAKKAPLPAEQADAILARVRARQQELGYADYQSWMKTHGVAPLVE